MRAINWSALAKWLRRPQKNWLFWFTFLGNSAAVVIATYIGSDRGFRLTSLILQVVGTCFVTPGAFKLINQWLSDFPPIKPAPVRIATGTGIINVQGLRARAEVWNSPNPSASQETRLDHIDQNLATLRDRIEAAEQEVVRMFEEQGKAINDETGDRVRENVQIRKELDSLAKSGVHLLVAGMPFLVVSAVMSTASVEWASLLRPPQQPPNFEMRIHLAQHGLLTDDARRLSTHRFCDDPD